MRDQGHCPLPCLLNHKAYRRWRTARVEAMARASKQNGRTIEGEARQEPVAKRQADVDQPEGRLAAAQAGDLAADRPGHPRLVPRWRAGLSDAHERRAARLRRRTAREAIKPAKSPRNAVTLRGGPPRFMACQGGNKVEYHGGSKTVFRGMRGGEGLELVPSLWHA